MARRSNRPLRCRACGRWRDDDEIFFRGHCRDCRDKRSAARRAATGRRVLAKAKRGGTLEREGQTFQLVVLPPKGRGRRIG